MPERPRVFATRELPGPALGRLAREVDLRVWPGPGSPQPELLGREAAIAEGLLCVLTDRIDATLLGAAPRLRVVSSCSVGVDHVDLAAATARGIPVGHTPGVLTETTADLAFGLLLAVARRLAEADRFVRGGQWTPARSWEPDMLLGRDVWGGTLGVVVLGPIGQAMARRALGFGMRVLGWSRTERSISGVEWRELPDLLGASDFVSIHLAHTPETHHLIGREAIDQLRPGTFLINTSRGGLVDEAALVAALAAGRLDGAALDVFEDEPLPPDSPLLGFENVVLSPHIGSASLATRARMAELCVENLLAALAGSPMPHCANPDAERPRS